MPVKFGLLVLGIAGALLWLGCTESTVDNRTSLSREAIATPEPDQCPNVLQLPRQVEPISLVARDGRTIKVHEGALTQEPWRSATETEYRQPFADGGRIVWGENPNIVRPPFSIKSFDCVTGKEEDLGSRAYDNGQVDVPVLDGADVVWSDWASRGPENGGWWIRWRNLASDETQTVLDSASYLPERGAVGRRPLVPEPQVDDGRFITWVKTAEPGAMNILVGNLDGSEAHFVTDSGQASSEVDIDRNRAVFLERNLAMGKWTWDVWLYEFDTNRKTRLTNAVDGERTYELPAIWGDYVAYVESIPLGNGVWPATLWLQRLSDNQKWALAMPAMGSTGNINLVKLSDGWLVWTSLSAINFVQVSDPSTVYRLVSSKWGLRQIEAHGGSVVWVSGDTEMNTLSWFRLP